MAEALGRMPADKCASPSIGTERCGQSAWVLAYMVDHAFERTLASQIVECALADCRVRPHRQHEFHVGSRACGYDSQSPHALGKLNCHASFIEVLAYTNENL